MNRLFAYTICFVLLVAFFVPLAIAGVTFGGSGGNVTLTNPDNSTFFFTAQNSTTYSYAGNANDGWWFFMGGPTDDEAGYWVIGLVFGLIAIALAVTFMVMKTRRNDEE